MKKIFAAVIFSFVFSFCGLSSANAATLTVTKIADTNDNVCDADYSLREAIFAATSGDTVDFAAPLFDTAQTIALTSELSVIGKNITISGRAANLTAISGENTSRVFNVGGGTDLTLDNLTVKNGRYFSTGGGIYNSATLTIRNSTISNNSVIGGSDNFGGGIYNGSQATLTIRNSTISGNTIAVGGFNYGGGVASITDGAYLVNSIISNNFATGNSDILGSYNPNSNFIGGDPRLAPLGFYGGATQTHASFSDSPVRNAGNNCVLNANACTNGNPALTTDQRGSGRIIGEIVDIGAFESNITFNQTTLPNGNTSVNYSQQLSANRQMNFAGLQNIAPTNFEIVSIGGQSLPPGITLSPSGLLTGMPTNFGIYSFSVKATDTDGIAGVNQYSLYVFSPTAANIEVSGNVRTASGNGITNALVTLTDMNGNVRRSQTGSFGSYTFDNIEAGQTYIISVSAKRFTFAQTSRVLSVNEDAADVNFIARE